MKDLVVVTMLTVAFENHRIAIDFYPNRIIVYDGKEVVNQKASKTQMTHHDFSDIIDGNESNYEITIKPNRVYSYLNGYFEIKRDGKLIFNYDDNDASIKINYMGHSIREKSHEKKNFVRELLSDNKVVYTQKFNLFYYGVDHASFKITENGQEIIYDYKRLDDFSKYGFSLTRNSKLLIRLDCSKSDANVQAENALLKEQRMGNAKVLGTLVGHVANAFTGGSGTEAGVAIKSVSNIVKDIEKVKLDPKE